jgi:succinate-acetate transporter protein
MLGIGYLRHTETEPWHDLIMAGGLFGLLSAFAAWYNAFAGIADNSNSFFIAPVIHFPWSDTGRSRRQKKSDREVA